MSVHDDNSHGHGNRTVRLLQLYTSCSFCVRLRSELRAQGGRNNDDNNSTAPAGSLSP